jgi:ATP-dependent helicase Lhr and Lhr-like helicase
VLAATDPANAYGAALPWPEPPSAAAHKPGRKAGSLVVLVDGELVLYLERGGRTLLAWPAGETDPRMQSAVEALADAVRADAAGAVSIERVNDATALSAPLGPLLEAAGFRATHKAYRLRP